MDLEEMESDIEFAEFFDYTKEELIDRLEELEKEETRINDEIDLDAAITSGEQDDDVSAKKLNKVRQLISSLKKLLEDYKNFDKKVCFSNIRELISKNNDVKIGQIEREAGVRLGYMSRLEKEGNTAEPSVEFVVSAAKLLHVSIDTLISVDLTDLTPTEQYIAKFFDKLKEDTLADKLDWVRETVDDLNHIDVDRDGDIEHPLFSFETFREENGSAYPNEVTRIVFNSKSFGRETSIAGDCFNLRLKNGTRLYLMDIEACGSGNDFSAPYAKEAWISIPFNGRQFLFTSQDDTPLAPLLETLFATVKDRMKHPKLNKDVMYAIDAFMNGDLEDDVVGVVSDDEIPF
ncbi:hypothetical protein D081_2253 [Anaerovibrio sp. JC8]|uniref:helix-turn-helix domain-containing protein n=1 Tax=Anaerovibrio sp. JC8 TaxID=1240085 RepID=UPI000A0D2842|nr:helix-turn-helix transcriptional regulator [Anaerovibrio sp. JC8]ORT99074.1 hypothetical protein D081_2253 [Anaerovibrio sp. JC8]